MSKEEQRRVILDVGDEEETKHVTKKEIKHFFNNLRTMPFINKEEVYQDILKDKIVLPKFEPETYFLNFFQYEDFKKDMVIIQDFGSDTYYYIQDEHVFKCNRYEAQNVFYGDIATKMNQNSEEVHDTLIDKLKSYEAILFTPQSQYLSSLDDFIIDNIYMFDAALKEKENTNKQNSSKHKIK